MKRTVVRAARLGVGSVLVIAGVISGFIPILQGWILILAGLSIMAPESEKARRLLEWAKNKVKRDKKGADAGEDSPVERSHDIQEEAVAAPGRPAPATEPGQEHHGREGSIRGQAPEQREGR